MIELLLATRKKEHFTNSENDDECVQKKTRNTDIIITLISFILSFIAAYLSWDCNTKSNQQLSVKIVCAINAFFFGILYIAFYYGFEWNKQCKQFYLVDTNINSECAKKIEAEILSSTSPEVNTSNATSTNP